MYKTVTSLLCVRISV